ncbi:MAG: hypothetical protein HC838_18260 [Spirulinaceae cyanobacterium RM2_2_10]|nr:hypothetical protein [Spirulinaceae cyanobacterium RM2_2_10]
MHHRHCLTRLISTQNPPQAHKMAIATDASVNPSVPSAVIATEPVPAATPPTVEPSGAAPAIAPEPPPLALSDIEAAAQKFATTFKGEVIELDLDLNVGTRPSQPIVALPIPEPDVAIASEDDEIPF